MKRLISLFISFILIFSMMLSFSTSEASASDAPVLIKQKTVLDLTGDKMGQTNWYIGGIVYPKPNGIDNKSLSLKRVDANTSITSDADGNDVLKEAHAPSGNHYMDFKVNEAGSGYVDNIIYKVTAKYLNHGPLVANTTNWRSAKHIQIEGGSHYIYNGGSTPWEADDDVWYDFEIIVDTTLADNKNSMSVKFSKSDADPNPISKTATYEQSLGFSSIRVYMDPQEGGYNLWKDIKIEYWEPASETTQTSILSVGSDGEVPLEEGKKNKVEFIIGKEIAGLTKDHIYVKDSQNRVNSAAEISISSAGADNDADGVEDVKVTATLNSNLAEWSSYSLHIDADCYAGYKELKNGEYIDVSDMSMDFITPTGDLAVDEPEITYSAGKVNFTTRVVNKLEPTALTLIIAIYDAEGKMVRLEPMTISESFTSVSPLGDTISNEADIASGQTAKIFMINGWKGLEPMFGKVWNTSYAELNP